jgi:protein O-GlcNAc transferase
MAKEALNRGSFDLARQLIQPLLNEKTADGSVWLLASGIELQAKKFDQAKTYVEKAIKKQPDHPVYLYNYATILTLTGDKTKAIDIFRKALAIKPDMHQALNNLGNTLRDLGRGQEAIDCYKKVFSHDQSSLNLLSQILLSLQLFCFDNHDELYEMHCELGRRIAARTSSPTPTWRPTRAEAGQKIRLGYLSPRFSREIVSYFFKPIIDHHDRDCFELYLYSATPRRDDMTEYFAQRADMWADIRQLSDTALCQKIVDDKIDILIDLSGHAPENRIMVTARKPAPVQISMLDYFDTTGIEAIDYYVTDSYSTPAGGKQKFTEKLITLGQPRLVYEPPVFAPPVRVRSPDEDEIIFGSFNRHQKIIPEVVAAWSSLLREVINSRLLLKNAAFAQDEIQSIFRQRFAEHGVDPLRISFRGGSPHEQALAEYGDMDIALDTFPYNGGLTTLEALWMGTPVITMEGERLISRQSAGMLCSLGLPEFVAQSASDFAGIGKFWSLHRTQLNDLRQSLRARMAASPLTDAATYTKDLESHFKKVWELYLEQRG